MTKEPPSGLEKFRKHSPGKLFVDLLAAFFISVLAWAFFYGTAHDDMVTGSKEYKILVTSLALDMFPAAFSLLWFVVRYYPTESNPPPFLRDPNRRMFSRLLLVSMYVLAYTLWR